MQELLGTESYPEVDLGAYDEIWVSEVGINLP